MRDIVIVKGTVQQFGRCNLCSHDANQPPFVWAITFGLSSMKMEIRLCAKHRRLLANRLAQGES